VTAIEIVPTGAALGAEVRGLDLREPLDGATVAAIKRAWLDHLVLVFRGQAIGDAALVRFSRYFGETMKAALGEKRADGHSRTPPGFPEVGIISNVRVDGVPIGTLGAGEAIWHIDMTYLDEPPKAAILHALEVPAHGGDTGFGNLYRVYETLPSDLRSRIADLSCKHDMSTNSAGNVRSGFDAVADVTAAPGACHRLLRTHPESGRTLLFLGRRRNAYIPGLPVDDSEALLDALWAHAVRPEFTWHHAWRPGDLLMWDNRCVMHRRDAFDDEERRVMHRTQIAGDRPFFRAA
jgi:taurine dioxygenase